ncbi:MAG: ATP-binding protein [Thermodesulfovibrionales bacterium]
MKRFIQRISILNAFIIVIVLVLWRVLLFPGLSVPPVAYIMLAGALIFVLIPLNSFLLNRLVKEPKKKKPQAEGITPHALLTEVEAMARELIKGKEIGLVTDCQEPLMGLVLHPDRTVFMRIVTGILLNAVAMTERGTITILFSLVEEAGNRYLEISVADTGKGMDPEVPEGLSQEFPFHPSSPELSVAMALLETLDGRIEIENIPGKGAVVIASIPLERII